MRSMSMTGAQGRKGPVGDASGIVAGDGMALSGGINAAAIATQAAYLDAETEGEFTFSYNAGTESIPVPAAVGLALSGFDFANLLSDLFSGSPGPSYYQQVMELRATQGGRHPLYGMIGISKTLIISQRGHAPTPFQYYSWGKTTDWLENLWSLSEFSRGGRLDAQRYGASPAYGRYVFGVYMAAHGYSLPTTLRGANAYGHLGSSYPWWIHMGGPKYPSIPASEVAEVAQGWKDERQGMYGLP